MNVNKCAVPRYPHMFNLWWFLMCPKIDVCKILRFFIDKKEKSVWDCFIFRRNKEGKEMRDDSDTIQREIL